MFYIYSGNEMISVHLPFSQEVNNAEKAVIFIHGFMGSPDQFIDLARAVYSNGCSYDSVLLPGHGVCAYEFIRFGIKDWEQHVQNKINGMREKYDRIYLVGHSMGGLLALNASLISENKIAGVFLISTPLKINFNVKSFISRLHLFTFPKNHEVRSAYSKSYSITKSNIFLYPLFIKPVISFYRLAWKTRKNLEKVFTPVFMIHSTNDETTSYRSSSLLYEGLCNTERAAYSISKSWHAFFSDDERKTISKKLLEFIQ